MKKVLFLMVDSLMPSVLEQGIQERTLPALRFLREQGQYSDECVTVFPTMTASVDSSLMTGTFPDVHKVPGLIWYNPDDKQLINYLNGAICVWKTGIRRCLENVLFHLNEQHLSKETETIFEALEKRGRTTASVNMIIHRSTHEHWIRLPFYMRWILGRERSNKVHGPDIFTLGSAAYPSVLATAMKTIPKGPLKMFGINDRYAIDVSRQLIHMGNQPDFMMIYLPDNDHEIHKTNPEHAQTALFHVDRQIQQLLDSYGSWEQAIKQNVIIITGDHGQTRIEQGDEYNIDLDRLLQAYTLLPLGKKVNPAHQLVVCNNERMAYVYPLQKGIEPGLLADLMNEARFDLIAWKEASSVCVAEGGSGRKLTYSPGGKYKDVYGQNWEIKGDLHTLDLHIEEDRFIRYGDYPDGLARLYGALFSQDIPLIVITARPHFELKSRYYPTHMGGGSHGSLHYWDSTVPLLVAGSDIPVPKNPRLVDLKNYILTLFPDTFRQ